MGDIAYGKTMRETQGESHRYQLDIDTKRKLKNRRGASSVALGRRSHTDY